MLLQHLEMRGYQNIRVNHFEAGLTFGADLFPSTCAARGQSLKMGLGVTFTVD